MITETDVARLLDIRTAQRSVLSLYLGVPADPAELREVSLKARGLVELAVSRAGDGSEPVFADEQQVRELIELHERDWLGHTAAIFAGDDVAEAFSLPCQLPDRAVIAQQPHVRPLLVARQRCPVHFVAIVDRQHAWLFRVAGDQIETAAEVEQTEAVRSAKFGGWYGLESHRINELVSGLASQHLQTAADLVAHVMGFMGGRSGAPSGLGAGRGREPLVVGGHAETIGQFTSRLAGGVRDRLAGTFVVDPHSMTPGKVRDLAAPVIADWVSTQEQRRAQEMRAGLGPHDPLTIGGLKRCLDAVNRHAVDLLVVPVGGVVDGYECQSCGELGTSVASCPDEAGAARWVPDLFEEMVTRTVGDGGRTEALTDPPGAVAARLRYPASVGSGARRAR